MVEDDVERAARRERAGSCELCRHFPVYIITMRCTLLLPGSSANRNSFRGSILRAPLKAPTALWELLRFAGAAVL